MQFTNSIGNNMQALQENTRCSSELSPTAVQNIPVIWLFYLINKGGGISYVESVASFLLISICYMVLEHCNNRTQQIKSMFFSISLLCSFSFFFLLSSSLFFSALGTCALFSHLGVGGTGVVITTAMLFVSNATSNYVLIFFTRDWSKSSIETYTPRRCNGGWK